MSDYYHQQHSNPSGSHDEHGHEHHEKGTYYLPEPSHWPIIGSIALTCIMVGAANWLHGRSFGPWLFLAGAIINKA